jgi:transcriptional regulator with XRE-family HTH domain
MELAASQFLRALRGRRSQVQLARRLGYRANPITDWERGERFPTAEEALRVAKLSGVDVPVCFARFSATPLQERPSGFAVAAWLSALRGMTPLTELAARSGASRFSIARWLKGSAKPRLPDFFRMLDALTGRLPEWIAELTDIEKVPSLEPRFRAASAAKQLAFQLPWTEAVLRLLETASYRRQRRHRSSFIAECLGIETALVQTCIERLLAAQVIEKSRGRYVVREQGAVDTQGGKQALHGLKRHWSLVAAERMLAPQDADFFAYNVMSLSGADLERVRALLRVTFREIRSLVAASEPEEVAALLNLQLVAFAPNAGRTPERGEPSLRSGAGDQ